MYSPAFISGIPFPVGPGEPEPEPGAPGHHPEHLLQHQVNLQVSCGIFVAPGNPKLLHDFVRMS